MRCALPGLPPLLLATGWEEPSAAGAAREWRERRRAGGAPIGLGLFGLAALRGFALAVLAGTVLKRPLRIFEVAALALSGVALLGLGLAVPAGELLLLLGGLALAGLGWFLAWSRGGGLGQAAPLATLVALVGAVLGDHPAGALLARRKRSISGATSRSPGAAGAARLGLAAALFGVLILAVRRLRVGRSPGRLRLAVALRPDPAGRGRARSRHLGAAAARRRHLARGALAATGRRGAPLPA